MVHSDHLRASCMKLCIVVLLSLSPAMEGARSPAQITPDGSGPIRFARPSELDFGASCDLVRVADLNGDGFEDLVTTVSGGPGVLARFADGTGGFNPVVTLVAGVRANALSIGLLNGDLFLDLVVIDRATSTVALFMGDGVGNFWPGGALTIDGTDGRLLLDDIDEDGSLDIAVTESGDVNGRLRIFQGDGLGGFTQQLVMATQGPKPGDVVAMDFDQNGVNELVVGDQSLGATSTYTGTLGAGYLLAFISGWGREIDALSVADIDQDGLEDLLIGLSQYYGNAVIVWYADGSLFPSSIRWLNVPAEVVSLCVRDINGDAISDVIVGDQSSYAASVFAQDTQRGFGQGYSLAAGPPTSSIALVDANLDGVLDIVAAAAYPSNTLQLIEGKGSGAFDATVGTNVNYFWPDQVVATDQNNDGRDDVILLSAGSNYQEMHSFSGTGEASSFGSFFSDSSVQRLVSADADNDGDKDLYMLGSNGISFSEQYGVESQAFGLSQAVCITAFRDFEVSDMDGNGTPEIITLSFCGSAQSCTTLEFTILVLQRALIGFSSSPLDFVNNTASRPRDLEVADINRDGNLDIVWTGEGAIGSGTHHLGVIFGDGTGGFTFGPENDIYVIQPQGLKLGDVNGDGYLDAIYCSFEPPYIGISPGTPNGGFGPSILVSAGFPFGEFRLADLNRDGLTDIVAMVRGPKSQVITLESDGAFAFREESYSLPSAAVDFTVGDFDGDQSTDITVLCSNPRSLNLLRNVGDSLRVRTRVRMNTMAGNELTITNRGLTPGREYFNVFLGDPCPSLAGSGPIETLGLCIGSASGLQLVADQLSMPLGAAPFHFSATDSTMIFGPISMPGLSGSIVDGVCFEVVGDAITEVSLVDRVRIP